MFKKLIFIGLISLGLSAISLRDAEAQWAISLLPPMTIGSVTATAHAHAQGSAFHSNVGFIHSVPLGELFNGLLACKNKGAGKLAPGIQLVLVNVAETLQAGATIQTRGPDADVTATASLTPEAAEALADAECPNANWSFAGYAPCITDTTLTLTDKDNVQQATAVYECVVNSCETATFDPNTFKFTPLPFTCNQIQ